MKKFLLPLLLFILTGCSIMPSNNKMIVVKNADFNVESIAGKIPTGAKVRTEMDEAKSEVRVIVTKDNIETTYTKKVTFVEPLAKIKDVKIYSDQPLNINEIVSVENGAKIIDYNLDEFTEELEVHVQKDERIDIIRAKVDMIKPLCVLTTEKIEIDTYKEFVLSNYVSIQKGTSYDVEIDEENQLLKITVTNGSRTEEYEYPAEIYNSNPYPMIFENSLLWNYGDKSDIQNGDAKLVIEESGNFKIIASNNAIITKGKIEDNKCKCYDDFYKEYFPFCEIKINKNEVELSYAHTKEDGFIMNWLFKKES